MPAKHNETHEKPLTSAVTLLQDVTKKTLNASAPETIKVVFCDPKAAKNNVSEPEPTDEVSNVENTFKPLLEPSTPMP